MSTETNQDRLIEGHDYDGIREFDNPLPGWWLFTFFATIIFAFIYYLHYEIAGGPSTAKELETAMAQVRSLKKGGPVFSEERLASLFGDESARKGQDVFAAKCAACHGPSGGGLIGPNLTDKAWLHGQGTRMDIVKFIGEGIPAKGMPAWAEQLGENDLVAVSSFVYSIKGTNAKDGKPPQGTEFD